MSVFDSELCAVSCACALQYAGFPPPKVISLSFDNQATASAISLPGYSYHAPILSDFCKATPTLLLSGLTVRIGWIPSHIGITSNELADAAAKLAAEDTPSDDFP